ncbi:MAG: hypothetical protein EOP09_01670, partial [Proteobacteria bacterium]
MVKQDFHRLKNGVITARVFPREQRKNKRRFVIDEDRVIDPKVDANIRVVAIGDFDFSPCGGTHCARTSQITS